MRKHSVRKWIHAICDLLPLLVIPIFALAVRSDNNFQPIEVQQEKVEVVNFNQLVSLNANTNISSGITFTNNLDGSFTLNGTATSSAYYNVVYHLPVDIGHTVLFRSHVDGGTNNTYGCYSWIGDGNYLYDFSNIGVVGITTSSYFNITLFVVEGVTVDNVVSVPQFFDLTLMFGDGKEPSLEDFNTWYSNSYYEYNTGTKQLLHTGTLEIFNDTDVGSQMVYTLYNTCDKYFNFNQVGLFQNVYDWFSLNIMNGTAPMSFYIVWNVILFEFIMDLIFLTYMVFMFIIDFTECMIDRFFEKSYRGGR